MDYFDARAASWDDPAHVERARLTFEAIRRRVPLDGGMRCLEYGCGTGLLSFFLRPRVGDIVLMDESEGMLETLRRKIEAAGVRNLRGVRHDLGTADFPGSFHLIVLLMSLHHIPDTDRILDAFARHLAGGGHLCVADLVEEDGSFHAQHPGFVGHNGFDTDRLAASFSAAGIEPVSVETYHEAVRRFDDGSERRYPLFLLVGRKNHGSPGS